jgi:hypothetical protein
MTLLRETWERPDGDQLVEALEVARVAAELAQGFFYRWEFPRGEKVSLIEAWKAARKEYFSELRQKLKKRDEHLDSPLLCWNAARRYWCPKSVADAREDFENAHDAWTERMSTYRADVDEWDPPIEPQWEEYDPKTRNLPVWKSDHWRDWRDIRDKVQPVSMPVRVHDYLARDAAAWAAENRGIVWYSKRAFGSWVAEISGLPMHGGGPGAGERIAAEKGDRSLVVSIDSHGTGRDGLQRLFATQLVSAPPSSNTRWEQLLGRLHRPGQKAKKVTAEFYAHTEEFKNALAQAQARAEYVNATMGTRQKLQTP